jgi:uncharacterized protein (TIGR02246 family)
MMLLDDLLAREAIRDLVARYNAYGDSGLFDRMMELFAPDAVLEVGGAPNEGHDEIRAVFTGVADQTSAGAGVPAYLRHCTSTHQIDLVDETTATGRCYFFVLTRVGLDHWGRYLDDYRTVDGEWRFARRRVLTDDFDPNSLFAPAMGQ